MKQWHFLILIFILNYGHSSAQNNDNVIHDAGVYNSIEWSAEDQILVIPQVWFYYKNYYIEARYNYEDIKTASFYFGRAFSFDKKAAIEITPMIGGVIGNTNGISPALNFQLEYKRFSTSTQSQYTFDLKDSNNNFFWDWTNFYISINQNIGLGGAFQVFRTKSGDHIYNLGPMLRFQHNSFAFETYAYNLWEQHPVWSLAIEYTFESK